MEDYGYHNMILSDVVMARCLLEGRLLFYNEYTDIVPKNHKLADVTYCEVKNIAEDSNITDTGVTLFIEFDLLVIYRLMAPDNSSEYRLHSERVKCRTDIEKSLYDFKCENIKNEGLRCRNLIRNIVCSRDGDISSEKLIIRVTADLESLLVKEDTVDLNAASDPVSLPTPSAISEIEIEDMDTYILQLESLLKKASSLNEANKNLKNDIASKDRRIYFLECRLKGLEEEMAKLDDACKVKDASVKDLFAKLEKSEKKTSALQNANTVMNQEIEAYIKGIEELKGYIQEQEDIKKNTLNYKIKSAISNMKLF